MSWLQSDIDFANIQTMQAKMNNSKGKSKSEIQKSIDKMMLELDTQPDKWQLPKFEITPNNQTLQSCITYLTQCPDKPFYKVLEMVEEI